MSVESLIILEQISPFPICTSCFGNSSCLRAVFIQLYEYLMAISIATIRKVLIATQMSLEGERVASSYEVSIFCWDLQVGITIFTKLLGQSNTYLMSLDGTFFKQTYRTRKSKMAFPKRTRFILLVFLLSLHLSSAKPSPQALNPLCSHWRDTLCIQCSPRSYFDHEICRSVDPLCKTFDYEEKSCIDCFHGYKIQGNSCLASNSSKMDSLCSAWRNGQCLKCSFGSFKDQTGRCKQIDPSCRAFNYQSKQCESCYSGYTLQRTKCVLGNSDSLCSQTLNGQCSKCSHRSYLKQGKCILVDPYCAFYDSKTGECYDCYKGYAIENGSCVLKKEGTFIVDPFCAQWDEKTSKCLKCSQKTIKTQQGRCIQTDPECRSFSQSTGNCLSCFEGYMVKNGKCIANSFYYSLGDKLCASWDHLSQRCLSCAPRCYFDDSGKCKQLDQNCEKYDRSIQKCSLCYRGYAINSVGICVHEKYQYLGGYNDPNCAQWLSPFSCQACAVDCYQQRSTGKCIRISSTCQLFDFDHEKCKQCYLGWNLIDGKCFILSNSFKEQVGSVLKCSHWREGQCLECGEGFTMRDGQCEC